MQITPQPKLVRIAATVGVLALVGFAYGVTQTLRNPNDRPHLPLPAPQAAMMNLDGVPRATPLDAAACRRAAAMRCPDPRAGARPARGAASPEPAHARPARAILILVTG